MSVAFLHQLRLMHNPEELNISLLSTYNNNSIKWVINSLINTYNNKNTW